MSSPRPPRRTSGSTRKLVDQLPTAILEGMLHRRYGFTRRDVSREPASKALRWVTTPSNDGGEA